MNLLKQIAALQGGGSPPGGAPPPVAAMPDWSGGDPNAVNNGFIAKLASGNPGGFIGALMKRANANPPVNPGAPPAPGSPAYVEGGVGPAMGTGGPAPMGGGMGMPGLGMLAKLLGRGGMGQFGGGSGAPRFNPGDLMG